ncbi:MAG TPA: arginase family protein [Kofleriaceae bacterium]|nr:arginase family protein [Kofleriaceae bacterium]
MTRRLAVLDAPRHLATEPRTGAPSREREVAYAMRQRALVARLGARDAGVVDTPCCPDAEPPPELRGPRPGRGGFQTFTEALARRTSEIVGAREFPVVLGGDCSILLGNMLALRRLGRYGLVFVDGHDEFTYAPDRHRPCGYFASAGLDLALATGNGPDALSNLYGLKPYVDERNVVLFGMQRDEEDEPCGPATDVPCIQQLRLERIRQVGARAAASEALSYLEAQSLDGFWIHVDADVLDREPVDCFAEDDMADETGAGGLAFDEIGEALEVFLSSERAAGLEMTIYDPELDPDGDCGDRLVNSVVRAFTPATA